MWIKCEQGIFMRLEEIKMSFSTMIDCLRKQEKGKLVFVKLGTFYVAVGEDAVLLHKRLNLKCTCYKMNICKVGFPVNSLDKYVEKLNEIKYGYVIYDYDSQKVDLREIMRKNGKANKEIERTINCLVCKGMSRYPDDKYMLALLKMQQRELKAPRVETEPEGGE